MIMNLKVLAVIFIFIAYFKICHSRKYKNFSLISTVPHNSEGLKFLQNLQSQKYMDVTFWDRPYKINREVQVVVSPVDLELFKERAAHFKLKYTVKLADLQRAFDEQTVGKYRYLRPETFLFNHFHNLDDIYQWMADLAQENSIFVHQESIGKSALGTDIFVMSVNKNHAQTKVIIEGGIHANEWMSVAFVLYLLNELVNSHRSKHYLLDHLANNYEWLIIPIVNPDGYNYSHNVDRLWRKNRNKQGAAVGVDLNRNFDHAFGKFSSSQDPKDDNYCGSAPFSEPESRALATFVRNNKQKLKFYFSFHSYGQLLVVPYEDRVQHVENFSEMENFGRQAVQKIFRYKGNKYSIGSIYDTTGTRISGTSSSWVKKQFRIPYVYTIYLQDAGQLGHALPSSAILPACSEGMLGLIELMTARPKYVKSLYDSRAFSFHCSSLLLVILGVCVVLK